MIDGFTIGGMMNPINQLTGKRKLTVTKNIE